VEVGAVTPKANRDKDQVVEQKREPVRAYYDRYKALPGWAAAIVVDRAAEKVEVTWQEWDAEAAVWKYYFTKVVSIFAGGICGSWCVRGGGCTVSRYRI
jgi:hypothetical protein